MISLGRSIESRRRKCRRIESLCCLAQSHTCQSNRLNCSKLADVARLRLPALQPINVAIALPVSSIASSVTPDDRHRASPARRFRHLRSGYRRLLRLQSVDRDDRLACPCIGYIKVSPRLRLDGQGFAHVQRDKDVKIARVGRNGRRRKTACLRLLAIRASSILGVGAVRSKDHIASK
jgi:hypothetical protein